MGPDAAFDSLSPSIDLAVSAVKEESDHPTSAHVIMSPRDWPGTVGFFRAKPVGGDQ